MASGMIRGQKDPGLGEGPNYTCTNIGLGTLTVLQTAVERLWIEWAGHPVQFGRSRHLQDLWSFRTWLMSRQNFGPHPVPCLSCWTTPLLVPARTKRTSRPRSNQLWRVWTLPKIDRVSQSTNWSSAVYASMQREMPSTSSIVRNSRGLVLKLIIATYEAANDPGSCVSMLTQRSVSHSAWIR